MELRLDGPSYTSDTLERYHQRGYERTELFFVIGADAFADIATWPWIARYEWQGVDFAQYPHLKRWYLEIAQRPAVQRGYHVPTKQPEIPMP